MTWMVLSNDISGQHHMIIQGSHRSGKIWKTSSQSLIVFSPDQGKKIQVGDIFQQWVDR